MTTTLTPALVSLDDIRRAAVALQGVAVRTPLLRSDALEAHVRERGLPFFRISGVSGAGVDGLVEAMWHAIATAPPPETTEPEAEQPDGPNLLSPSRLHRHA